MVERTEPRHVSRWARARSWMGEGEIDTAPLAVLMILPALVFLLAIIAYPVLYALWLSFRDVTLRGLATGSMPFVGLENYHKLARDPVFWNTMKHSAQFVTLSVSLEVSLGLSIALLISHKRAGIFGRVNRALMLVPWAVPPIVNGLVWFNIYHPSFGYLNVILYKLGVIEKFTQFVGNPRLALPAVVAAFVWRVTPFTVLLLHAALQTIPGELYDAAEVDGADAWGRFRFVTFPLIRSTLAIVLVLRTTFAFMVFEEIFAITSGGPGDSTWVAAWYTYQHAFGYLEFGVGSAAAYVMALIVAIVTAIYMLLIYRRVEFA